MITQLEETQIKKYDRYVAILWDMYSFKPIPFNVFCGSGLERLLVPTASAMLIPIVHRSYVNLQENKSIGVYVFAKPIARTTLT